MANDATEFESKLEKVLVKHIAGCSKLVSAERLSGGIAQETYRLSIIVGGNQKPLALRRAAGGEYVKPSADHPGIPVEALLMKCAREAGVPEPEVHYVLTGDDDLGDGFIMEWLDGEALGARIVRSDQFKDIRPKLAYECGRILAKIHRIDLKRSGLDRKLAVIPPDEFVDQTWERYKQYHTPQPMIDYTARWLKENLPGNSESTLVHNEFRNGNIMISAEKVIAVLDWEAAHIGDPMRDLGWLCTNSWRYNSDKPVGGFGDYQDLFRGYEDESGKRIDAEQVKFWEVFGSFWWAVVSLGLVHRHRTGLDKSVEQPAAGRRSSESQVDCVNLIIAGPVEVIAAPELASTLDMPSADELLTSVRDFLRQDVMGETSGRTNFLARVASNSLDIVIRERALGSKLRERELARLIDFYETEDNLENLSWRLVSELRDGTLSLENDALKTHLRSTVVNQIAIDQPKYSGYRKAVMSQ